MEFARRAVRLIVARPLVTRTWGPRRHPAFHAAGGISDA